MSDARCPYTSTEIKLKSDALQCSKESPYHCLRNEMGQLMEKCIESSWIPSGYCAEYNALAKTIHPQLCDRSLGICPDTNYFSNNVMAYSSCVHSLNTSKKTSKVARQSSTTDSNSVTLDPSNNHYTSPLLPLWIILPLLLFLVVIAGGFIYMRLRRRRRKDSKKVITEESTELVSESLTLIEESSGKMNTEEGTKLAPESSTLNEESSGKMNTEEGTKLAPESSTLNETNETKSRIPEEQSKMYLPFHKQRLQLDFFNNSHYTELEVTKTLREWIKSGESVLITGDPGSGKTSLAWNTCVKLCDAVYQFLTFTDFESIPTEFDSEKKTVLLLDDCFEIWNHQPGKVIPYIKRLHDIKLKTEGGTIQVIITISSLTFKNIQNRPTSLIPCVNSFDFCKELHLSEKYCPVLSDIGKLCIAYQIMVDEKNQAPVFYDNKNITEHLKSLKRNIGVPLSLYIFSQMKKPTVKAGNFFKDPWSHLIRDIDDLRSSKDPSEQCKYCTLIYVMLKGGIIDNTDYDTELLRVIGDVSKISHPTLDVDHYLLRQKEDGRYEFIHESILRLLFKCFGNKCPKILLNHCDQGTILRYLRTNDKKWTDVYVKDGLLVIEKPKVLELLVDLVNKKKIELTGHSILRDESFRKKVLVKHFGINRNIQ